jgi:hypothetical protein
MVASICDGDSGSGSVSRYDGDSGSDSGSDSGTPPSAAPPPAAAAAAPQSAKTRVTDRAFDKAKLAHKEWTEYLQTLSEIYKDEPNASDMVRARHRLQEFETIMREYHDSRAAPPLALRRVK